ncbi:hypothetical protein [uncultured Limosilactobacillus sp.]|uniref:hypothetical protein n=1 Tax=uncultured Limosilactobacillus sp. TaxID=2837629 RepID=UPI0025EA120E|nr:hypothetical protein [uncultured Limosilactobacillus sp.]
MQSDRFFEDAYEEVVHQFCDTYNEEPTAINEMFNGQDAGFLSSHFYDEFKAHHDSKQFDLLTQKIDLLHETQDEIYEQQSQFQGGENRHTENNVVLAVVMAILMFVTISFLPFLFQLVFLVLAGFFAYRAYVTKKYTTYQKQIDQVQTKINNAENEQDQIALPFLKKMFDDAVAEWKQSAGYLDAVTNAQKQTDEAKAQLAQLNLDGLKMIPQQFRSTTILTIFSNYLQEGRADSWKECVNLYHQEKQFDESRRHYREQEEHNREEQRLHEAELSEQRRQSDLASQNLDEARAQTRLQNDQLDERRQQTVLSSAQLDELRKGNSFSARQLREMKKQTTLQGKHLNETHKQTNIGKTVAASSILQNAQLNELHQTSQDIAQEQKEHHRWEEKGFRTKKEEENYREAHPFWSTQHPRRHDNKNPERF